MLSWPKAAFVICAPLLILCVGLNAAVFVGCGIAYLGQSTNGVHHLLAFIPIPESARYTMNAALLVVDIGAVLIFLWRLRVPLNAARRNHMTLKAFALLPLQERWSLIQSALDRTTAI